MSDKIQRRHGLWRTLHPYWWLLSPLPWVTCWLPVIWAAGMLTMVSDIADAQDIDGKVTRRWITSQGHTRYLLAYTFTCQGKTYNNASAAPNDIYKKTKPGDTIKVHISARDASKNRLTCSHNSVFSFLIESVSYAGLAALTIFIAIKSAGQSIRSWCAVKSGARSLGSVYGLSERTDLLKQPVLEILYKFEPSGVIANGPRKNVVCARWHLSHSKTTKLRIGDTIPVLYDPAMPWLNAPADFGDFMIDNVE